MEKKKAPPVFNGEEGENYLDWRMDIELWEKFTDLEKKRATVLLLQLKEGGKVKNAVRSLGKEALLAEDGLKKVLGHLDKIYKEDEGAYSYRAYSKFEKFVRPKEMTLQNYMSEFEKLIAVLKKYKIELPQAVLAYRFLNSANLLPEKVDLVLANVKTMTYKDMSEAVKRLFSVDINNPVAGTLYNVEEITVKNETEGCYYLNNFGQSRGSIQGTFRGGYRGGRGYRRGNWSRGRGTTSYTGCYKCQGLDHFMRNCPKLKDENSQYFSVSDDRGSKDKSVDHSEITYITLFADASSEYVVKDYPDVASLVHETLACAVIDSGCGCKLD